ncbi:MAG: helix-turn-helix domain-containing protein [Clostridia bacterium]|nr:helix-turn-helix domain-containing protein [Clostridia bacterium]
MNNNILLKPSNAVFEPHIYNNMELPFIYHNSIIHKCDFVNFHENLELLYFTNGSGYVECDTECYPVKQGDVVVVNSYVAHQIFAEKSVERVCIIIDNSFCKYHNLDISRLHFTPLIKDEKLNEYFDKVVTSYESNGDFKYAQVKNAVLNLLLFLCLNYSVKDANAKPNYSSYKIIHLATEYIKKNISQKISLDSVAASVGLSKYHFLREFKKKTGFTLSNYINIIRCEYAKELFNSGKYSVKEVALLCGFDNFSYFTNVFKKHMGSLPSEYIKAKK